MKKHLFLLGASALLVAAGGVLAQQAPATRPAPAPGTPQALFADNCAGCHGTDLAGGRGPSLFADALLNNRSDAEMLHTIQTGRVDSGMPAWGDKLSEPQIMSLIAYLRIQGGNLRGTKPYVPDPTNQVIKSEKQTFKIEIVAAGLDTPWGEAFLPDGRMVVTERSGHIRIIGKDGKLSPEAVKNTPAPWVHQDGGYFDIAVHPDYAKNGWIYLAYSELLPGYSGPMPAPNATSMPGGAPLPPSMTHIVRGKINANNEWVDQQDIFKADAGLYTPSIIHYGSRFLFDGKGHLFWTMGDRGDQINAQKLSVPLGKIHRMNDDGTIPKDNPFVNTPGAVASIWSYGHRNPEGLSYDPVTGALWESEHGPTGGDEINIIEKGHNYGWGVVSMGLQPGIDHQHEPGMDDPITYYSPSIGPSGIAFYKGNRYPGWKNNLFVAALVGQKFLRFDIKGRAITHQETLYQQFGRTRDVITGPDGLLYVLLQNPTGGGTGAPVFAAAPGMVIRLAPVR